MYYLSLSCTIENKFLSDGLKNKEKRKNASLTTDEWLGFFFIPLNPSSRIFPTKDFNDYEEERFKKFGFENKTKQSLIARVLGIIFYIVIIGLLIKLLQ